MTAITFPTDPANDELYTAPNGTIYIWDGEKWVVNSTIYTGPALENLSQDRVAPMFVNGVNTGITFAYNATTNVMTTSVADSDRLVNGLKEVTLGASGLTTFPSFTVDNVDQGENLFIQGPEIGSANSLIGISAKDDVIITSNILTSPKVWTFGTTGNLSYPNTALQRDTDTVTCAGNASTVVYTASSQGKHTIRLLIQVEGNEGAPVGWDTQACEMIIAKSFRADDVAATVYAVVHTSVAPLATFSAEWNALTSRVEVLCATPSANTVYVRTFATEITTAD